MSSECSEDDLPLVTIITPTYNSNPQYLKEAIESVLEQTYPKIEYIITDDGSSVFHEELIHELLEAGNRGNINWKIIQHDENVGTVKNMNGAIRESHGEYIFPLAHDDVYYDKEVISEWVQEFHRLGAQVITGLRCVVTKGDVITSDNFLPSQRERDILKMAEPSELHKALLRCNFIAGASTAYSRKCIIENNLFNEKYKLLEDYPAYLEITRKNHSIILWERPVIRYRSGGISSTSGKEYGNLDYDMDISTILLQKIPSEPGFLKLILFMRYILGQIKIKIILIICRNKRYNLNKISILKIPTKVIMSIFDKIEKLY